MIQTSFIKRVKQDLTTEQSTSKSLLLITLGMYTMYFNLFVFCNSKDLLQHCRVKAESLAGYTNIILMCENARPNPLVKTRVQQGAALEIGVSSLLTACQLNGIEFLLQWEKYKLTS